MCVCVCAFLLGLGNVSAEGVLADFADDVGGTLEDLHGLFAGSTPCDDLGGFLEEVSEAAFAVELLYKPALEVGERPVDHEVHHCLGDAVLDVLLHHPDVRLEQCSDELCLKPLLLCHPSHCAHC